MVVDVDHLENFRMNCQLMYYNKIINAENTEKSKFF